MLRNASILTLSLALTLPSTGAAQGLINFDELAPSSPFGTSFTDPYKGMRWATGAHALAYITEPSIGSDCRSVRNCAFNSQGYATQLVRADGGLFVLSDFWRRDWHAGPGVGAATSATSLRVRGFVGAALMYDDGFSLGSSYALAVVSPLAVNRIEFVTHGGSDFTRGDGGYFLMDDMRVTGVVPEPATLALLVPGVAILLVARRRRQSRGVE